MFPFSPFAEPTGSFPIPVPPPPESSGGSCSTLSVQFPSEWLPYILGALQQLILQSTWQGTPEQIIDTQQRAQAIIGSIQHAVCVTGQEEPGGISCGDECMCCLRWNNGVLQVFSCGTWTDVPGGGPITTGTPSAGQGQPKPGGGTEDVCLELFANGTTPLGINVSSGDTILIFDLNGTWRDDTSIFGVINCPDGYAYVEGICVVQVPQGSPDPVPSALHMGLIIQIASNFYDVLQLDIFGGPTLFTVPSGISNQPVFFQANIANRANASGKVSFCATVTNNAPQLWERTIDYTVQNWGANGVAFPNPANTTTNPAPTYIPGTGWEQGPAGGNYADDLQMALIFQPLGATCHITQIQLSVEVLSGTATGPQNEREGYAGLVDPNTVGSAVSQLDNPLIGATLLVATVAWDTSFLYLAVGAGSYHVAADATQKITKLVISGTGTPPPIGT